MGQNKPSTKEEEYFAKEEAEKKKRLAENRLQELKDSEKQHLKEMHWMHCPKCGMELDLFMFRGVQVDKCFHCGGVYLDEQAFTELAGEESSLVASISSLFK